MIEDNWDIIIVGAGPVGLTAANLLGIYGIKTLVLEKDREIFPTPRAVGLDDEALRIWQSCGLIDDMMPYIMTGNSGDVMFTYYDHKSKPFLEIKQSNGLYGYPKGAVFLQPEIQNELIDGLKRFDNVKIIFGYNAENIQQTSDDVIISGVNDEDEAFEFNCKYALLANGGKSNLRKSLHIEMQGELCEQSWLVLDVKEDRQNIHGVKVWCNPDQPAVCVPLPNNYCRWEFMLPKNHEEKDYLMRDTIAGLIQKFSLNPLLSIERRLIYKFNARIASQYSKGNIFLIGDAAHVTPPFAAQGLATGLRDAANIAWKVASVLKGMSNRAILYTYEKERRLHQKAMINLALSLGKMMMPKNKADIWLRANSIRILNKLPFNCLQRMMLRGSNIEPSYKKANNSKAGQYIIQPIVNGKRFDDFLGNWWSIITFGDLPSNDQIKSNLSYSPKIITLSPENEFYSPIKDWLVNTEGRYLIIRPDRFIEVDSYSSL